MDASLFRVLFLFGVAAAGSIAGTASGQSPIRLFGVVIKAPGGRFLVDGTAIELHSALINLNQHTQQLVDMTGTLLPGPPNPNVDVATIVPATREFRVGGDNRIGRDLQLRIDAPQAAYYYYFWSFAEGFVPLEPFQPIASGTLLLDLATTFTGGYGVIAGLWAEYLAIPNDPRLIGVRLLFQAAVHEIPGPLLYLNLADVVFRAP